MALPEGNNAGNTDFYGDFDENPLTGLSKPETLMSSSK